MHEQGDGIVTAHHSTTVSKQEVDITMFVQISQHTHVYISLIDESEIHTEDFKPCISLNALVRWY